VYNTFFAAALVGGYLVFCRQMRRQGAPEWQSTLVIAATMAAGWIGAKTYYLTMETDGSWLADPVAALLDPRGHAFLGGFVAGVSALIGVSLAVRRRCRTAPSVFGVLDAGAPAWLLAYAVGRIGCHASGDGCYGIETDLPWGMAYPDGLVPTLQRVHPTPLYEAAASLAGMAVALRFARRNPLAGRIFGLSLLWAGSARFLVEFIRLNPRHGPLTGAQWIAVLALLPAGLWLWRRGLPAADAPALA
jgi:phosphatidylglycerol:prolipoprotein diacylglycerol transferase